MIPKDQVGYAQKAILLWYSGSQGFFPIRPKNCLYKRVTKILKLCSSFNLNPNY